MTCYNLVRGRVSRLTRLNECGAPVEGACSVVVSNGVVSTAMSPQYDEGEAIIQRNQAGELCINVPASAQLTSLQTTLTFCQVDPDMFELALGYPALDDADGNIVGFSIGETDPDIAFALETWAGIEGGACGATPTYGYQLIPWLSGGRLGDWTIENGAVTFSMVANSRSNSPWGAGPYNVQDTAVGAPVTAGPLITPVPVTEHARLLMTTIAPPAATCGCTALDMTP